MQDLQDEHEGEQEAKEEGGDLGGWRHGPDSLADRRIVQRGPDAEHKVREASPRGGEADGPVPAQEVQRGGEHAQRDLDE